jgi:hypothetical protein
MQQCLFCGHTVELVHVHGHYQCPVCYSNVLPCCDADNCDTNVLLNKENGLSRNTCLYLATKEQQHKDHLQK